MGLSRQWQCFSLLHQGRQLWQSYKLVSQTFPPAFHVLSFLLHLHLSFQHFGWSFGASWVYEDTSSRQDVKLGLMHAVGSSLGSVNSDSLYQCSVCKVVLTLCGVGQTLQLFWI